MSTGSYNTLVTYIHTDKKQTDRQTQVETLSPARKVGDKYA